MVQVKIGGSHPSPQTNKTVQWHNKVLEFAQELLLEEIIGDTIFACGQDFTTRIRGQYGWYETMDGQVVTFQPKKDIQLMLICDDFVVTDDVAMIRTIAHHVDDYELSLATL